MTARTARSQHWCVSCAIRDDNSERSRPRMTVRRLIAACIVEAIGILKGAGKEIDRVRRPVPAVIRQHPVMVFRAVAGTRRIKWWLAGAGWAIVAGPGAGGRRRSHDRPQTLTPSACVRGGVGAQSRTRSPIRDASATVASRALVSGHDLSDHSADLTALGLAAPRVSPPASLAALCLVDPSIAGHARGVRIAYARNS